METKNQQEARASLPIERQMEQLEKEGKPTYMLIEPAGLFSSSQGVFIKVVNGYITDVSTPSLCLWKKGAQGKEEICLQKDNYQAYSLLGKSYKGITSREDREINPNLILIGSQWVIAYGLGEPFRAN